jgi:putative FmdB family regulatory protein
MPIYEYTCLDCGKHFETLRSMKDADAPIHCIQCDSQHTARQVSSCYAQSGGRVVAGSSSSSGCAGCSGGSCSACGH